MTKYKKAAIIMVTLFFGSICAGYLAYDIIVENVQAQIEENKK